MAHYPKYTPLIGLGLLTLLSRLPFLSPGYGMDPDSARVVLAARHFAATGDYIVSRFPGYPVIELTFSLVAGFPPWVLTGLTALMSSFAVVLLSLIARDLGVRRYLWLGFALGFTPIIYVESVTTMDYLWALTFVLAAVWFTLRSLPVVAGIALGLAIGCRLTSGALILPLVLLQYRLAGRLSGRLFANVGRLIAAAAGTAFLAFLPALLVYGHAFLTYYPGSYPDLLRIARSLTVALFGRMGTWALVLAVIGIAAWPSRFRNSREEIPISLIRFQGVALLAIGLWLVLFLRLPFEPSYLIPIIPFGFLVLARWARPRLFTVVALVIAVGSFVHICRSNGLCRGTILADHQDRIRAAAFVEGVLDEARQLPDSSLVVVAWWEPALRIDATADQLPVGLEFVYTLDSARLAEAQTRALSVYYLPEIASTNAAREGIRLEEIGAKPLVVPR